MAPLDHSLQLLIDQLLRALHAGGCLAALINGAARLAHHALVDHRLTHLLLIAGLDPRCVLDQRLLRVVEAISRLHLIALAQKVVPVVA